MLGVFPATATAFALAASCLPASYWKPEFNRRSPVDCQVADLPTRFFPGCVALPLHFPAGSESARRHSLTGFRPQKCAKIKVQRIAREQAQTNSSIRSWFAAVWQSQLRIPK
jgi:hypothetical protein